MKFLMLAFALNSLTAFASTTSNCTAVREAKAKVTVNKLFWEQVNGDWQLKAEQICKTAASLKVLPGRAAGCLYDRLAGCTSNLDGVENTVTVFGTVYHADNGDGMRKFFVASYNIDREVDNSGNAQVNTRDLGLKEIGVYVNGKIESKNGVPLKGTVAIEVDFEDPDAP